MPADSLTTVPSGGTCEKTADVPESLVRPTTALWQVCDEAADVVLADGDPSRSTVVGLLDAERCWSHGSLQMLSAAGVDVTQLPDVEGRAGAVVVRPGAPGLAERVIAVGIGDATTDDLRTAGAEIGRRLRETGARRVLLPSVGGPSQPALDAALVEGVTLTAYPRPVWRREGPVRPDGDRLQAVLVGDAHEPTVQQAAVAARATLLARNLGNAPSNVKNPEWLHQRAREVAQDGGLKLSVWDEHDLVSGGFGGLLAVGGGSVSPPRLVRLDYRPEGGGGRAPVVLVGKGITFDSGGLDIKPADGMVMMKTDMLASAVVLAVLGACREVGVAVPVTGLLALAENAVSGSSYRPGDVIAHHGGRTSEVGNTDAEGRLVLADALAYADLELDPEVVLDVATLTGAARVALARTMAPVYATDDALRDELLEAGERAGERLWPFPLHEPYAASLDSEVADLSHVSDSTVTGAGSITAALFLKAFVGGRRWAHLDIAGPGRSDAEAGVLGKGATAFSTRLLLSWLRGRS